MNLPVALHLNLDSFWKARYGRMEGRRVEGEKTYRV